MRRFVTIAPVADICRIHYHRSDLDYAGWQLYAWGDTLEDVHGFASGPVEVAGSDEFGVFFDVRVTVGAQRIGVIIHRGNQKDPGPDMQCNLGRARQFWIVSGSTTVHSVNPITATYEGLEAFWVDRKTVCVPAEHFNHEWTYFLAYSAAEDIPENLDNASRLSLAVAADQSQRLPQLNGYKVLEIVSGGGDVAGPLKAQLVLAANDRAGRLAYLTGVQIAGVLDDVFAYEGPLGATYSIAGIEVRLWAPTARAVDLLIFMTSDADSPVETIAMQEQAGVWHASVDGRYKGRWYLFRVGVFVPAEQSFLQNLVTDPYSVDLAMNGSKSRFTDLDDPRTKPTGWDDHPTPPLTSLNDLSIYELHVRDFSSSDLTVPAEHRGGYLAFTHRDSNGMKHLEALADAGLKIIHLLPTFHFSSVNEDRTTWQFAGDLAKFPPDSVEQQAAILAIRDVDAYNWGYDPVHYMAPAGAYAVDVNSRVFEYRQMVQALHGAGLRVVQDAVFNHTSASGQMPFSVLDKIVPGYYYRLDPTGNVYNNSCCSDTASEHRMMERLMIDTVVMYAQQYRIDGFRFDLMSFHLVANMERIKAALEAVRPDNYLYGEGWNFGETGNDQLGLAARQMNMYGLGIGTFNDRVRDAIRGGNPFSDQRIPGFATGADDIGDVLHRADWIRVALTGNLRDYQFVDCTGTLVRGGEVDYFGQPAGYTASPVEVINYCSVHDNQTLFDAIQLKAPAGEDSATRARRQLLAMSIIALGQGIPFFMAGDDLLRSKDMDQNSYNSGDWFNKIDWTYQSNNWGIGLPIATENEEHWPMHGPLLADPGMSPVSSDIEFVRQGFAVLLRIRMSSQLFRMKSLEEIQAGLTFLNTGPNQIPRLIVMLLQGETEKIAVVFNANKEAISFTDARFAGMKLHPLLTGSSVNGTTLQVPALTTAVFIA